MIHSKCLWCKSDAEEKSVYKCGSAYECPECGRYFICNFSDIIHIENSMPDDCKKRMAEYLKSDPYEKDDFRELTLNEIKKWSGWKNSG